MNAIKQAAALMQKLRGDLRTGSAAKSCALSTIEAVQSNIRTYEELFASVHSEDVVACPAPVFVPPAPPSYAGFAAGEDDDEDEDDEDDE